MKILISGHWGSNYGKELELRVEGNRIILKIMTPKGDSTLIIYVPEICSQ